MSGRRIIGGRRGGGGYAMSGSVMEYRCGVCKRFFRSPTALRLHCKKSHDKSGVLRDENITYIPCCSSCGCEFESYKQLSKRCTRCGNNDTRY